MLLLALISVMTALAAPPILVHGHRGARAVRPESTLPAFQYALDLGVDVLELDMAVTRDDVVVVSHDPVLNEKICSGPGPARPIHSMTFAELQQWDCGAKINPEFPRQKAFPGTRMPALDQVFELARGRRSGRSKPVEFNIETKISPSHPDWAPPPKRFVELVLAVIRKHGLEDRVILQSFDFRTLAEMRQMEPRIRLSALTSNPMALWREIAKETGAPILSPERRLVTADRVREAHGRGVQVVPWTANEPDEWERLVDAKVDAIITDDPAALIRFLEKRGLR